MHDLVVIGFHDKERASEVLAQLLQLAYDGTIDLFDAVSAHRTDDGKLHIDDSVQPTTREAASWGAVFGGLLGALIAGPFTAGLSLAGAAAAAGLGAFAGGTIGAAARADDAIAAKAEYGLSDDFVRQVGGMIQPGDSAVFALLESKYPDSVAATLRGFGGTLSQATLSPQTLMRMHDTLRA